MESIRKRLDRVLDHLSDLQAKPEKVVLSGDDWTELFGEGAQKDEAYRDIPIARGEIGQSSYVATTGGPNGAVNFGI